MTGSPGLSSPPADTGRGVRGRLRSLPLGGPLRRGVLLLAGGTAAAQVIVALASPVVSRLFTPAEFGASAAAIALMSLLLTVTCLTFDHAIPLPGGEGVAGDLLVLSGLATLTMSAVSGLTLLIAGERILDLVGAAMLAPYAWLLVVGQLAGGITLALTGWALRDRRFGAISGSRVTQGATLATTQIAAGIAGMGAVGLLLGDILGRVAAGAHLFRLARRPGLIRRPRASLLATARRYRRFPLVGTWPTIINAVALELPVLLLAGLYGPRVGGLYAFAQRLIAAPVVLVVLSIGQTFVAEAAHQARADPGLLHPLYRAAFRKLVRIGAPILVLVSIATALLVAPVFGDQWRDAGLYLAILIPFYVAQLVTSPLGGALDVLERQELLLVRELVRAGMLGGAVVVAELLGLSATGAVVSISVAGTLSYWFYGAVSWHALRTAGRPRAT